MTGGQFILKGCGVGRRKLVRQGGWPLDYAREAAEEAGYLNGSHNGTSTVNDEWQNAALNYAMTNVASVATCAEIASALG